MHRLLQLHRARYRSSIVATSLYARALDCSSSSGSWVICEWYHLSSAIWLALYILATCGRIILILVIPGGVTDHVLLQTSKALHHVYPHNAVCSFALLSRAQHSKHGLCMRA